MLTHAQAAAEHDRLVGRERSGGDGRETHHAKAGGGPDGSYRSETSVHAQIPLFSDGRPSLAVRVPFDPYHVP